MRWLVALLLLIAPSAGAQENVQSETIIADVSKRHIAITVGFSGTDTTLFGALPENGDVIVTVTGPEDEVVVRRKERVLGVWLNRTNVTFNRVPGFYWIAASRGLTEIASEEWLAARRIGTSHLRFIVENATDYRAISDFLTALIDLKVKDQLFFSTPAAVTIMGGRLYRADVHIPADAPTGEYILTTYLLQNGQLVGSEQTPLTLRKEGSMAQVSTIAENYSIVYAVLALLLALMAGWTSAVLMQRS
jgi:uncharacterized protein (TIGR02186 family)